MTAYELEGIVILNAKDIDVSCILGSISSKEAVNRLNSSMLEDKGVF